MGKYMARLYLNVQLPFWKNLSYDVVIVDCHVLSSHNEKAATDQDRR